MTILSHYPLFSCKNIFPLIYRCHIILGQENSIKHNSKSKKRIRRPKRTAAKDHRNCILVKNKANRKVFKNKVMWICKRSDQEKQNQKQRTMQMIESQIRVELYKRSAIHVSFTYPREGKIAGRFIQPSNIKHRTF